jgi:hypothetical protein
MIFTERKDYEKEYKLLKIENENLKHSIEETKNQFDSMVERRVLDIYSSKNWLVNPNHVFTVTPNSNIPYINQEPITKEKAGQLKSEADLLDKFLLWNILQETVKQKAINIAVMDSTNFEQVMFGKAMIHNLGIIKAIVTNILKLDISKIPEKSGKQF